MQIQQQKEEGINLICEFISLNSDIASSQISRWVLKSCFTDKSSAMRIFSHVLNLESNKEQKTQAMLDNKIYSSLFENFQLVAEGTLYSHDFYLPKIPFQIFKLEKYSAIQYKKTGYLYTDYSRFLEPDKQSELSNDKPPLNFSILVKSGHLKLMESFVNSLACFVYVPIPIEWITMVVMKIIAGAVANAEESSNPEKHIKVIVVQHIKKELELTISCVATSCQSSNECNNLLPIDDDDLKKRGLNWIKDYAPKIYFLRDGAEITLTFSKILKSRR